MVLNKLLYYSNFFLKNQAIAFYLNMIDYLWN